ncbi:MAG TPA: hypothetical protein QF761_12425 [Pirellulales bacterium]|nr:hypothetical protein [Pirellulales bacterium]
MRLNTLLFLLATLLCLPLKVDGQQIAPNPNPVGNYILLNGAGNVNNVPYDNNGTLGLYLYSWLDNWSTLTNNSTIISSGSLVNHVGSTLENNGLLENEFTGYLLNDGTFVNNGHAEFFGGMLDNVGTLENNSWLGGGFVMRNYGTLNNQSGATLIFGDTMENDSAATLNNSGTLENWSSGTLTNNGTLNNYGTLTNDGTFYNNGSLYTTSGTFDNWGTYGGGGVIYGNWYDQGVLQPGQTPGVVTIEGNYYKQGGSIEIELGGLFDGGGNNSLSEFDWLDVTGNVELAGALDVYLINSFQLLDGMSFEILNVGGTLTGEYDGLPDGALVGTFSGTDLFINYAGGDGNDVTLFSQAAGPAVPEPATLLLALFGLALLPRRRRR